jgi:hypothetical protein
MRVLAFALSVLVASPAGALLHADAGAETGTGFLDVSSDPPAKILIDDTDTGKVTPQPHLELKVGHHKLTLVRLDGGHNRSLGFTIAAGQTRKFTLHLAQ